VETFNTENIQSPSEREEEEEEEVCCSARSTCTERPILLVTPLPSSDRGRHTDTQTQSHRDKKEIA
jgi:hypothetical protein